MMLSWKTAACLAAGNTVVIKPAGGCGHVLAGTEGLEGGWHLRGATGKEEGSAGEGGPRGPAHGAEAASGGSGVVGAAGPSQASRAARAAAW